MAKSETVTVWFLNSTVDDVIFTVSVDSIFTISIDGAPTASINGVSTVSIDSMSTVFVLYPALVAPLLHSARNVDYSDYSFLKFPSASSRLCRL
jgi:hypothetical protein